VFREKVVPPKMRRLTLAKASSSQPLPQTLQLLFQLPGQAISKLFEEGSYTCNLFPPALVV